MKLLFVMMITAATLVMPRSVEASELNVNQKSDTNVVTETDEYEQSLLKTVYAKKGTEIFEYPDTASKVLDVALKNTSFEVLLEADGWTMISTSDTPAFVLSADLSDEPIPEYTDEELEILTRIITGEAHGSDDMEQRYVASVVLNRVASKSFPNSIKSVAFQKGQYACTWDGNYYRTPTERNWENARYVLENGPILPSNVVFQANFKQGRGVYLRTKSHMYCYE